MLRNVLVSLGDALYYSLLRSELEGMKSVLDVGCGARSPIGKIPKTFHAIGFDVFEESVAVSKKIHIHDDYILGDVRKVNALVPAKSVDAVIALDLIEHLTKKEGEQLLSAMERIAKRKVIVMTPNGFYPQEPYEKNPYQVHKSGWTTQDFRSRGYNVLGIRGFKMLRGEYATIRWKPWFVWGAISALSQYILLWFPKLSYQLFATKNVQ